MTIANDADPAFGGTRLPEEHSLGDAVVVEDVGVSSKKRSAGREQEFHFVEVGERTCMVRCRQEWPYSVLGYHGGFAHWRRTAKGELRWMVSVETDRDAWPVLREAFADEAGARSRVSGLETGLKDGSIKLSRWPAAIRLAPWLRPTGSG